MIRIDQWRNPCGNELTGWTGMLSPTNVTSGESNGYLLLNLNNSWKCSPSYSVPSTPSIFIFHLQGKGHANEWIELIRNLRDNELTGLNFDLCFQHRQQLLEVVPLLKTSIPSANAAINKKTKEKWSIRDNICKTDSFNFECYVRDWRMEILFVVVTCLPTWIV